LLHINYYKDISFIYFLQENLDLHLCLVNCFKINDNDFTELEINNKFNKIIFKGKIIFILFLLYKIMLILFNFNFL